MTTATAVPSVRRLAQYRPFARGGLDLRAVIKDLVLAAAAINDGQLGSLFDCKNAFEDLWNLQVEIDELPPVVDGLVLDDALAKSGKTFALSAETASELKARAREWDDTEQRAFREWELAVRKTHPQVSDEELTLLGQDLRSWLHQIISRHGAEAAMMLYPEQERARQFFEALDAHGFEQLPERDAELCALREEALPLFVRCATPDQRQFLAGLLNTSFYMCVLTIDPEAKHLVQGQMKGQRIYLDTNFLYAVIGAAPPQEVYSSRRLVQMCKDLGFELAYTPWTESELRTSIAAARRVVDRERSFVRSELAETMLRVSGDKGFTRYFWQAYQEKGTKPEDVFDRLEHFDADLERMGVTLVRDGCPKVERQEERIQEYAQLLNRIRWPEYKEWVVLEHDAKCRLLVEQQRGAGNIRVSNAGYLYIDKPMRDHGLLQAIARVNRVFRDKPGGLVVDYIGIGEDLRASLRAYDDADLDDPVIPAWKAVAGLGEKYEVICAMLHPAGYRQGELGLVGGSQPAVPRLLQPPARERGPGPRVPRRASGTGELVCARAHPAGGDRAARGDRVLQQARRRGPQDHGTGRASEPGRRAGRAPVHVRRARCRRDR